MAIRKDSDEYLFSNGWQLIGIKRGELGVGIIKYWSHPNHMPRYRGAFTKQAALSHQKLIEKYRCDCPKDPRSEF